VELNGVFKTPGSSSNKNTNVASGSGASSGNGNAGGAEAGAGVAGLFEGGVGGGLRKDVQFKTARVDFGGFKVTFPHMDIFGVQGWLETTFVDGMFVRVGVVLTDYPCPCLEYSPQHIHSPNT
jgi:hypothetical protein